MSGADGRVARTTRRGALMIAVFWCGLLGALYLVFDHIEQQRQAVPAAYEDGSGELVIPRGHDGHFRLVGEVNGHAVVFLVDTGATSVSVSEALAEQAGLTGGQPTTLHTANGPMTGRVLRNVPVRVGHLGPIPSTVAIGLVGLADEKALLGMTFLSRYDIHILQHELRLIPRPS
jgi:aspartyl protease family protein